MTIVQNYLKSVLSYNPKTGVFVWINSARGGWNGKIAGCRTKHRNKYYITIGIDGKIYKAHQLAFLYVYGYMPKLIDHKDGDGEHNWIKNLKDCTSSQNAQNHDKEKRYKKLGIIQRPSGRYEARIAINKKKIYLGMFDTRKEALNAYKEQRNQFHYHPATEAL